MRNRNPKRRAGYVLVMTLLLVGLCGMILARIAQHGLHEVLAASREAAALQQKWAEQSCRLQFLHRAEGLLESAAAAVDQAGLGWPYPAMQEARFRLGEIECQIFVMDEEAKPNLNKIYSDRPEQVLPVASSPFRSGAARPLLVKLSPASIAPGTADPRPFDSWGQVYDMASAGGNLMALRAAATQLTCWGHGKLNVARASDEALELVAGLALNGPEAKALVESRAGYVGDVNDLLTQLDVPGRKKVRLRRLLTDRSSCFSLWLAMRSGNQTSTLLAIRDASRHDVPAVISFHWP